MPEMRVSLAGVMAGIYLHIPFCKQACHYCDFHFSTNTDLRQDLVRALADELGMQAHYLDGATVETIYFGGGTPSLLPAADLEFLLAEIVRLFPVHAGAEVTLEANPDDLSPDYLGQLRRVGVNRLSIGIQSFDDAVLKFLNRAHTAASAVESVVDARRAGFENISIDLIFAIPHLTTADWKRNIARAVALDPQHISAYGLTIEPRTVFGNWARTGRLAPVEESLAALQLEVLMDELQAAGFHQYEISNFARPGYTSRHNSSYWKGAPYLGVGPGAHSYNLVSRQSNVRNNHAYVRAIRDRKLPAEREVLTVADNINEYILTKLRTAEGLDLSVLATRYSYDVRNLHAAYLEELVTRNLIQLDNNSLRLTRGGKLVADQIASDLFLIP